MRWIEFAFAAISSALFIAFHFLPGSWCGPAPVRPLAGVFIIVTAMLYLNFVDDERRTKVGSWHRILVGSTTGVIVAVISHGSAELYVLLALVGAMLGYVGFRWLKHVPF
jgi:hypothetical protein